MRIKFLPLLMTLLLGKIIIYGQENPVEKGLKAITPDVLKAQIGFLASDWTEGREAGEKGEYIASDYIAGMLQLYGVRPFGDLIRTASETDKPGDEKRSYFQKFVLLKSLPGDEQILRVRSSEGKTTKTTDFTYNVDFFLRPSDPAFEINAPVVFAGYGYKNVDLKYNDFDRLDLKGKFVLKVSGFPEFIREKLSGSELEVASREMESVIKEMGAVGIIEFLPGTTVAGRPEIPDFMNMSPSELKPWSGRQRASYSIPGKTIPDNLKRVFVSERTANEIIKGSNINFDEYISKADQNQLSYTPQLTGKEIYLRTSVITTQVTVRNVLGIIEGSSKDQVIVVGAHYDHVGMGNGYIWNGADDNASGTVGVMTIAKAIMATGKQPARTIIIALWTAEEEGLLGSRYYLDNPRIPVSNHKLNVNFDMISRYITDSEPDKVTLTYNDTYPLFKDITVSNLQKYGIGLKVDYQPSSDPPGGSDHRSFVDRGIPVMRFKPGHREEYHTPDDETGTLDWDIMEKIIRISFTNIWDLANSDW